MKLLEYPHLVSIWLLGFSGRKVVGLGPRWWLQGGHLATIFLGHVLHALCSQHVLVSLVGERVSSQSYLDTWYTNALLTNAITK